MFAGDMKNNLTRGCIELNNVSHSYDGLAVLKNLSLNIRPDEFVVLVGPTGCGKSTLLNIISSYLKPQGGSLKTNGNIRTVFQKDGLFPWLTVAENISMGLQCIRMPDQREKELNELLSMIQMEQFQDYYPHQLSGGMRQKVELARALAGDSNILLMDEPFSSLDYQTRLRLRTELVLLLAKRRRTVIFVTHDIEEAAQLADRLLVLSDRPARIRDEVCIGIQKPRDITDSGITEVIRNILIRMGLQTKEKTNDCLI
jgi:NitT/TauT family transport system ATP-binding protein